MGALDRLGHAHVFGYGARRVRPYKNYAAALGRPSPPGWVLEGRAYDLHSGNSRRVSRLLSKLAKDSRPFGSCNQGCISRATGSAYGADVVLLRSMADSEPSPVSVPSSMSAHQGTSSMSSRRQWLTIRRRVQARDQSDVHVVVQVARGDG